MEKKKVKEEEKIIMSTVATKSKKEQSKELLQKFINEETKLVKGRFKCFENPGDTVRIQMRKYPGIPMFDRWMRDGEIYEIPLYVARHLNGIDVTASSVNGNINSCAYNVHAFKWDANRPMPESMPGMGPSGEPGIPVPIIGISKTIRRYGFESLEFSA